MAKKKKSTPAETGGIAKQVITWIVGVYVFFMLVIYPLFYHNKYYDMCDAKWLFYKAVTGVFFALALVLILWYVGCFLKKKEAKAFFQKAYRNLKLTDWLALAYLVVCCISTVITPYQKYVIWGADGWYMGLVSQISFVLIYFLISRFWKWDEINLFLVLVSAFLVFFLAVIMRFRIDPLNMYEDLDFYYVQHFLSTLGQVTWYSSYMCLMIPLGLIAYILAKSTWSRIAFGLFCVMGFLTMVSQNSDSAYMAMFVIFFMLFWIAFESDVYFLRGLECLIMAFGSFAGMGVLQRMFPEQMVALDSMSVFMSQSVLTIAVLVFLILFYWFVRFFLLKQKTFSITKLKIARKAILIAGIAGAFAVVIYVALNSMGKLPAGLSSTAGYLVFNDTWGNNRGVSWRCSVLAFFRAPFWQKLFGAGPDSFEEYLYLYYKADLDRVLEAHIIQNCAHNEWLNTLINLGVLGLVSYLGIFVSSFLICMKEAKKKPCLYGAAIAVLAYFFHNFFCYQQIICTPTIFILMGMAASVIRNGCGD